MAWVVGVISVGPPLGVDPVGKNAVADLKQTNKKQTKGSHKYISLYEESWCVELYSL